MICWKFTIDVDLNFIRNLQGTEGNFLNPVFDVNDNIVLSNEEYICDEFQFLKIQYADIFATMEQVEFISKPFDPRT